MEPILSRQADSLSNDEIEIVEKLSLRLVFQALAQFRDDAWEIFERAQDDETEIAEDITREALDNLPGFPISTGYSALSTTRGRDGCLVESVWFHRH